MKRCMFLLLLLCSTQIFAQESFWDKYSITSINMGSGLPHNFVDDILKDDQGFMWLATNGGGLVRYDGYTFETFDVNSAARLRSNFIHDIAMDNFKRLWISNDVGIDILDLETTSIVTTEIIDEDSIMPNSVTYGVTRDNDGNMWFISGNVVRVATFDKYGNVVAIPSYICKSRYTAIGIVENKVWLASGSDIYEAQISDNKIELNLLDFPQIQDANALVTCFYSKENEVWIGTDDGIFRVNTSSGMLKRYITNPTDPTSLSQNRITDIVEMSSHDLIISTLKGINVYSQFTDSFEQIQQSSNSNGLKSLSCNFVNCLLADDDKLWIGTEICGVDIITSNDLSIRNYINTPSIKSISPNPVNAIIEDSNSNLWVGNVEGGLNCKRKGSNNFEHYTVQNHGLAHNSISALAIDGKKQLWAGTWGNGISILDISRPDVPVVRNMNNFGSDFIGSIIYDKLNDGMWVGSVKDISFVKNGVVYKPIHSPELANMNGALGAAIDTRDRLWLGVSEGLVIIDLSTFAIDTISYRVITHKLDDPESHLSPRVTFIYVADDGQIYIGSNGYGFYRSPDNGETFISYTTKQGLTNNTICGITEDATGNIWISTNCGMSVFDPYSERFVNYTVNNGMICDNYYWNAAYVSPSNGKIYFGSPSGLTEIRRRVNAGEEKRLPKPIFTNLYILNTIVQPGSGYLTKNISRSSSLTLHERDKSFSLEFASLVCKNPESVRYQYRLAGFDDLWIEVPYNRRIASYTNLPPGNYTFQVRSTDGTAGWSDITSIDIHIEPFFYKTIWFYAIVILIIALILWRLYRFRVSNLSEQKRLLHLLVQQRTEELQSQKQMLEAKTNELETQNIKLSEQNQKITMQKERILEMSKKIQKLSVDKIQIFTNISHEFRTPITLIMGPIQRLLRQITNSEQVEQLQIIDRNSKNLLQLVNQLMDFRKVETGNLELHLVTGNLATFVDELIHPFVAFASERNIKVESFIHLRNKLVQFDTDAMNKILTNLLSNAVKFSNDGGHVRVFVASINRNDSEWLYISVSDKGDGIPEAELEKVFVRFYQSENHSRYSVYGQSGTGIGLYLCKRLVLQHGGEIIARNNPGGGCSIRIFIPYIEGSETNVAIEPEEDEIDTTTEELDKKMAILVVEDNKDMRLYVRSILSPSYNVVEAHDGVDGLAKLAECEIDFIICDLMMPIMNGLEFSSKVRHNFSFSHIPILVLTAQISNEYRTQSYRIGIDAYLHKPFDEQMLLARISGIFEARRLSQRRFQYTLNTDDLNISNESDDEKFIRRVLEYIKANYQRPEMTIDDIMTDVGCSKSMLNKKMQSLVGESPGVFIRSFRLNLAKQIIIKNREHKVMNISQIAYEVGFSDPKYFTRCFNKYYGVTPSAMLEGREDATTEELDEELGRSVSNFVPNMFNIDDEKTKDKP